MSVTGNDMVICDGKYLRPSKETRLLALMDSLSQDPDMSQFELGRRLKLSGAMVNQYLNQLQSEKLVEFQPVNGKSFRYVLTDGGDRLRHRMFADYSSETIRLYTTVKGFIQKRLAFLRSQGLTRLALFGASETCEVVLSAIRDTEFQILALVDNEPAKQGRIFHGHIISAGHVLESLGLDAVVITSFGKQDEIFEQLKPLSERKGFAIVRI